ncbi:hypothetical protein B484DRAFT_424911, partial [Ochromonadaceae sp. CCMP2298]
MLYDLPMRKDAVRTEIVLETKRRFVRFVSHEIRTPLNTVNMGLTLFGLELDTIRDAVEQMGVGQGQGERQSGATSLEAVQKFLLGKVDELKKIARDVTASTEEAVVVLNDLLSYDKIESGIFVLEFAFVAVDEVVQRSMATFLLQARDKNVALTLRTITEDEGQLGTGGWASGIRDSGTVSGSRSSAQWLESGMGALELDPRYQLIGDGSRLGQVLRNLLSNALKFTNPGGSVAVTVQRVPGGMPEQVRIALPEESGLLAYPRVGSVRISVVDSGAGLSEQQVLDIGKEGLQFNVSALQGGGGSGLGLFISKGLVQQHGGQMTVTSLGLDRGVSTTLEFPLFDVFDTDHLVPPQPHADSQLEARGADGEVGLGLGLGARGALAPLTDLPGMNRPFLLAPLATSSKYSARSGSISGPDSPSHLASACASPTATATASPAARHMLVVDDAVSNRKLLMRIFRLKGFECKEAHDGQDALQKYANMCAQGTPPSAILMDYEMPVLNGPSATRQLREQGCSCLIMGVTGNVMQADVDFFKSCGADAVFAKPLNADDIMKLITKIASPKAGSRGSRGTGDAGERGTGDRGGRDSRGTGDPGE